MDQCNREEHSGREAIQVAQRGLGLLDARNTDGQHSRKCYEKDDEDKDDLKGLNREAMIVMVMAGVSDVLKCSHLVKLN